MSTPRLLFVLAHPDDESFGSGALIARYTRQGTQVSLICATNGDVGTVDAALLNGYASVADLRLAELKRASDVLGFHEVVLLGYRDSGMMGSPTTEAPQSLWHTWQTDPETVIRRVTAEIRRLKPQVVVTFNATGAMGIPITSPFSARRSRRSPAPLIPPMRQRSARLTRRRSSTTPTSRRYSSS